MRLIKIKNIKEGFKASLLIIFPYLVVAFISGVFLESAGLSFLEIGLMSLIVNAGSAQLVSAAMIMNMDNIMAIILTSFVINFRHLLYASSLSLHIRTKKISRLLFLGHTTTDESFAINTELYSGGEWTDENALAFGFFGLFYWVLGNILGGVFGDLIKIPSEIASFTLIALFIILIVLQADNRKKLIVALLTIPLSLGIMYFYRGSFNIILISSLAALVGYLLDRKEETSNDL